MVYKWYLYCQLGDGLCHRSHLLGEPFQQPLIFIPGGVDNSQPGTSKLMPRLAPLNNNGESIGFTPSGTHLVWHPNWGSSRFEQQKHQNNYRIQNQSLELSNLYTPKKTTFLGHHPDKLGIKTKTSKTTPSISD